VVSGAPVSVLIDHGLGDKIVEKLLEAGVGTIEKLGAMTPEQLEEIPGIGPKTVETIQVAVNSYYAQFEEGAVAEAEAEAAEPEAAGEAAAPEAPGEAVAPIEAEAAAAPDGAPETAEVAAPDAVGAPASGEAEPDTTIQTG
jgi:N utilization substance protein A